MASLLLLCGITYFLNGCSLKYNHPVSQTRKHSSQKLARAVFDLGSPTAPARRLSRSLLLLTNLEPNGRIHRELKDFVHTFHLFAAALDVGSTHTVCYRPALFGGDGRKALRFEEVDAGALRTEIGFEPDEDDGCGGAEVEDFRVPLRSVSIEFPRSLLWPGDYLVHDIFQRVWAVDGEADEEEIGFGVREGPQAVIFFLASCVPQSEFDSTSSRGVCCLCDVIFEDRWHIFLRCISQDLGAATKPLTSGKYPWL